MKEMDGKLRRLGELDDSRSALGPVRKHSSVDGTNRLLISEGSRLNRNQN